jgi:hypothetical protein
MAGYETGLVSIMKNFDHVFLSSIWEIIHIQETLMPGILKLWVRLPNNLMYPVNLKVMKKIYIDSKVEQPGAMKVMMTLPRGKVTSGGKL